MGWRLPHQVSFCWSDGQAIFLDVGRDRYFALPAAINTRFADWVGESAAGEPPAALVQNGLIESIDGPSRVEPCSVTVSVADICGALTPRIPLDRRLGAARATIASRIRVRTIPLGRLLASIERKRALVPNGAAPAETEALAAEFAGVRSWLPFKRTCLADSLALVYHLARCGACPTLVFGVTARPFAAHCWVQTDRFVLNDAADNVARYVPIRAL